MRSYFFGLLVFILAFFAGFATAQETRSEQIEAARSELAQIRRDINNDSLENTAATEARLRTIRDESRHRMDAIQRDIGRTTNELDLLGPAPGENDTPESEFIASQRSDLTDELSRLTGERTRVNANIYETGDLLARISGRRLSTLYGSLFERGVSPLDPSMWRDAGASTNAVAGRIGKYFSSWGDQKRNDGDYVRALVIIGAALVISIFMFGPVNRWVSTTFWREVDRRKPTQARRVAAAGLKMIARTAPGVVGGFIIIETLRVQGIVTEQGEPAVRVLWFGLLAILLVSGFTSGLFAPANPAWRIAPVDAARGRQISNLALAIIVIFSLKTLLITIGGAALADPALARLIQAGAAIIIGVLLFLVCRTRLWRAPPLPADDEAAENKTAIDIKRSQSGFWRVARRIGRALAILMIVASLAGYVALADFLASRFVYLIFFAGLAWLVKALLEEFAVWLRRRVGRVDTEDASEEEREVRSQNFRFWTGSIINTSLFVAMLPGILVLFGVPGSNVRDLAVQAFFGFQVGSVRIPSIANLMFAIVIFVTVMAITKLIQRGVERGPLAHSDIDSGVQNSLITLLGYAGLVIAVFAGISAIGFNLGNLALIAGALSVGIGFGLQSVVNNFVSGLILLFERPIKVGDWIVTASGEGTVKRISVRSTEIETFDRASIIVPNSELISSTVTNWTHKNRIGRITVPIGVSYDADPEEVKSILLKCANDHHFVVRYPEAFVVWQDFGESSLDFEVRAFLADISKGLQVRSELRFAIFKALSEAGIEIPFPQRDLHVKSMAVDLSGAKLAGKDA